MVSTITYKVDGIDFSTFGIYVSGSKGVLDLPTLKQPQKYDWSDYHGEIVDLDAPRYNTRSITLDSWIETKLGMVEFANKINQFYLAITKPGAHQLLVYIDDDSPLAYMVYMKDGMSVTKAWREIEMFGTFQIKLEEPEPVKRVIQYTGTKASITFKSPDMFNIYWGDGNADYDVSADSQKTVTHTYSKSGTYFICFSGNTESLSVFTTNGSVIWG